MLPQGGPALTKDPERRRGRAGPRPFGRRDIDRVVLTARQREVLGLVADGHENRGIADRLGISEQGVKQHVSVLLRKFGVPSRAMLARSAITMRLLGRAAPEGVPYEYLFDRAPILIAMSRGPEHEFTLVNQAFVSFFGERDYVGRTLTECFPEASVGILEALAGVIERGEPWAHSERLLHLRTPEGAERQVYLSLVAEATRAAAGEIEGIVFYAWDSTAQVAARRQV